MPRAALQFLMTREITHMKAFSRALESMSKPVSIGRIAPTPGLAESELSDTAALESALTDPFLGPDEGLGFVVIRVDVSIDVFLKLLEAGEGGAAK
jgi:hypothetical protein